MAKRPDPSPAPRDPERYDLSGDAVVRPGRSVDRSTEPYRHDPSRDTGVPSGPLDMSRDPDRYDPSRDTGVPSGPLDMSRDPDRYDPSRDTAVPSGPLDMSRDPDRFDPVRDALGTPRRVPPASDGSRPGTGQTLPGLLGEGAQEDERDNSQWLLGLVCMVVFLLLVTLLINAL